MTSPPEDYSIQRIRRQVHELKAAKDLYATPQERLAYVISEVDLEGAFAEKAKLNRERLW